MKFGCLGHSWYMSKQCPPVSSPWDLWIPTLIDVVVASTTTLYLWPCFHIRANKHFHNSPSWNFGNLVTSENQWVDFSNHKHTISDDWTQRLEFGWLLIASEVNMTSTSYSEFSNIWASEDWFVSQPNNTHTIFVNWAPNIDDWRYSSCRPN